LKRLDVCFNQRSVRRECLPQRKLVRGLSQAPKAETLIFAGVFVRADSAAKSVMSLGGSCRAWNGRIGGSLAAMLGEDDTALKIRAKSTSNCIFDAENVVSIPKKPFNNGADRPRIRNSKFGL